MTLGSETGGSGGSGRPVVADTSGMLAAIDAAQNEHTASREVILGEAAVGVPFVLSPFVLAELDYLLATRVGDREQMALLAEVERGAYRLEPFSASDVAQARKIMEHYADLGLGLADASNLVLCNRHTTPNILTLDYRHFRAVSGPGGKPLRLLPSDS